MAIKSSQACSFGETRSLYLRLNNIEASNHGVAAVALFRGYISKEAYDAGHSYVYEKEITFDADITQPLWGQAYAALKTHDEFVGNATDV